MPDIIGDKNANKSNTTTFKNTRKDIQENLIRLETLVHAIRLQAFDKHTQHIVDNAPAENIYICNQNTIDNNQVSVKSDSEPEFHNTLRQIQTLIIIPQFFC